MAAWFNNGRLAIFEALSNACDDVDAALKAELQKRDAEAKAFAEETRTLRLRANEADRLEKENRQLREKIARLQNQVGPSTDNPLPPPRLLPRSPPKADIQLPQPICRQALAPISANGVSSPTPVSRVSSDVDWKLEATKLKARYSVLEDAFKTAKETLARRNEALEKWRKYVDRLQEKGEEERTKSSRKNRSKTERRAAEGVQAPLETTNQTSSALRPSEAIPAPGQAAILFTPNDMPGGPTNGNLLLGPTKPLSEPTNSQSSRDGGAVPEECEAVNDLDLEKGRGEREVGRPRHPSDNCLPALGGESNTETVRIKPEPSSDTPVVVSERPVYKRKIDELGSGEPSRQKIKREMSRTDRCTFSPQESIDLDEVPAKNRVGTPRKQQQSPCPSPVLPYGVADAAPEPTSRLPDDVSGSEDAAPAGFSAKSNLKVPPSRLRWDLLRGIGSVAEDGTYAAARRTRDTSNKPNETPTTTRLDVLLNREVGDEEPRRILPKGQGTPRQWLSELPGTPLPRQLPFEKETRSKSKRGSALNSDWTPTSGVPSSLYPTRSDYANPEGLRPPADSLRYKPAAELRLEDFKINPKFNEGYDFAFSEVVRDKDERACLPGCVDMACCGKEFRALALAERGSGPRSAEQEAEDKKLLEEHLGDEAFRIPDLTRKEWNELWLQAKMKQLADKYGRHRHRHSRMKSPPGFWRTDFPSTQDIEEERMEAQRRQEKEIQERYKEAKRPGGRWVFRDE